MTSSTLSLFIDVSFFFSSVVVDDEVMFPWFDSGVC